MIIDTLFIHPIFGLIQHIVVKLMEILTRPAGFPKPTCFMLSEFNRDCSLDMDILLQI